MPKQELHWNGFLGLGLDSELHINIDPSVIVSKELPQDTLPQAAFTFNLETPIKIDFRIFQTLQF